MKYAKRVLSTLIVSLGMLGLLAGVALAASYSYYFPITITDTSGSARSNIAVLTNVQSSTIYSSGYMTSTGTDTNMQSGSDSVSYMLSTTQVPVFVSSLPANGQVTCNLYTGYSPVQTTFDVMVGNNGYVTITDWTGGEPGDDFEYELSGWVDTSDGSGKYLIHKEDAFQVSVSDDEEITALIYDGLSWTSPNSVSDPESAWGDDTNTYDNDTGTWAYTTAAVGVGAYSDYLVFSPASAVDANAIRYYVAGEDAGEKIDIDAYYDSAWHDVSEDTFTSSTWQKVDFADLTEESVSQFRIRFYNVTTQTIFSIYEVDIGQYLSVTATGVSSGEHKVEAYADGSDFKIEIDDSVEDTISLSGASVPNNSNDWKLMQNNAVPYMEYYKYTYGYGGQLRVWYQPTAMITSTTVPDREGTAQDGTITWGSNSDITITYGATGSSATSILTGTSAELGFDAPTMPMPDEWYSTAGSLSSLPMYESLNLVANSTGIPLQTIYMGILISTALALATYMTILTRSAIGAAVIIGVFLIAGAAATIIPVWILFAFLAGAAGLLYLRGKTA